MVISRTKLESWKTWKIINLEAERLENSEIWKAEKFKIFEISEGWKNFKLGKLGNSKGWKKLGKIKISKGGKLKNQKLEGWKAGKFEGLKG